MKTATLKMDLLSCSSRTALSLAKVSSTTERNQESGSTFSTMARCNPPAASRTERSLVGGNGSSRLANRGRRVASTMKGRSTAYGSDTTPMANSGTKVASNRARRRAPGRSIMRLASFKRRKLSSSGTGGGFVYPRGSRKGDSSSQPTAFSSASEGRMLAATKAYIVLTIKGRFS